MLRRAILYEEQLQKIYVNSLDNLHNKYYHLDAWSNYKIDIKDNDWEQLQYVSVDKNKTISEGEFRNEFINYISKNKESVKSLNQICQCLDQRTNVLLLCFEKKNDFCHRHILAEIFDELGYETKEI